MAVVTSLPETTSTDAGVHATSFAGELRLLTRGSSFGFIGQAANALLAFAFSLAVGRLFHAQGTGTFFEALAIFTIASNVGDLGADDGLNWSLPRLRASGRFTDIRRLLPIACIPVLVLSSLLAVGLFVYAVPLAHLFNHGHNSTHLSSFIRILCPFVPVAALVEVLIAGTRGFDRVWPLAAIWSVIMPIGRLVLLPLFLAAGIGLLAVAYAWSIPIVLGAAAMFWTLWTFVVKEHRTVVEDGTTTPARDLARTFWFFSAPRALASICAMALVWLDVLLVGYLISVRMAGIYGVANRYLVVVTFALAAAGGTIGPQVSRLLAKGKVEDVRRLYQTATGWVVAIGWPLSLTLALFAPLFMRLFGAEFRAGATALTILALMMLYVAATGNNMVVLVMSGRTSTSLWVGVVTLALNVGANLYLIPRLGINGAALGVGFESPRLERHHHRHPLPSLAAASDRARLPACRRGLRPPHRPAGPGVPARPGPALVRSPPHRRDRRLLLPLLPVAATGAARALDLLELRSFVRILMVAFACRPGGTSETGAGWAFVRAAALLGHDVTLITQPRHRAAIEDERRNDPTLRDRLSAHYIGLPARFMEGWERRGRLRGLQLYNLGWQWATGRLARRLHRTTPFDLGHHVTLSTDWIPTGLVTVPGLPVVWGPLGGGERVPESCRVVPGAEGTSDRAGQGSPDTTAQTYGRPRRTPLRPAGRAER